MSATNNLPLLDKIVNFTLPHISREGWSLHSFEQGALDAGVDPQEALQLFENTIRNVVKHYNSMLDRQMVEVLKHSPFLEMKIRERIAFCIMTRLKLMSPHREAAKRTATFLSLPHNISLGTKLLYRTVSAMWYAAGDTSTDFNFYSKRVLLAGVYSSTFLYWLNDESIEYCDTEAFLQRRIGNVMAIPKLKASAKRLCQSIAKFLGITRTKNDSH